MTVKQFCKTYELTQDQFYGKEKVGGGLDLSSLTAIPEGFNPTVGDWLDLSSLTAIPEGFNPTVGGSLDLRSLQGKKPKVQTPPFILHTNGCVIVDGILGKVISQHGNTIKTKKVGSNTIEYVIVLDDGTASHGATLKEASESLVYKLASRDTSQYKKLVRSSVVDFKTAIQCYRAITGACEAGTRGFVERTGKKESYTIQEIIDITKGSWGHDTFARFF